MMVGQMRSMRRRGISKRKIAAEFGISRTSVIRLLRNRVATT
ncbi:MAG: helix-turn-helix domain-containing protein [Deltaproteobacteria bacterium]|nr:helix-turn-helix domain-containing protein [Deltaproteobacteria bacterium]